MYEDFSEKSARVESDLVKVFKIFLVFALILLLSQVLQFINTKIIDNKHNRYLIQKNELTSASQAALLHSSRVQRALLNMAITTDPAEKKELHERIVSGQKKNEEALAVIGKGVFFMLDNHDMLFSSIQKASLSYKSTYDSYLHFLAAGERNKALELKNLALRPALETYQELLQKLLMQMSAKAILESKEITTYTDVSSGILFLLGISPFIYMISALVYAIFKNDYSFKRWISKAS